MKRKFIIIEYIEENGKDLVSFKAEGLSNVEIVGLLTCYRDSQIIQFLHSGIKEESNNKSE